MSFSEWKKYYLGDIYDIYSGLSKNSKEFGFGYPFLSFKEVFHNYFIPDKLDNLVNSTDKERVRCSIKRGDIFLTRTSETQDELGMSSVALKDYENATFNGFTKRLRLKNNISVDVNPEYIGYYLRSHKMRGYMSSLSAMTTRASLNSTMISKIEIELPEYKTQVKIGKTLKILDERIELNNRINKKLEEIAQAIFKSWFVEFEPFQDGEFEDSELGMIPKGWKVVEFSEISAIQNGFAFKSDDYQLNGCNMIRTTNIGSDGFVDNIDLINLPHKFINESKYQNFRFETFDTVLVMVGASVGKVGIITEKNIPALQNQNMWRFRPTDNNISPIYIHYCVRLINDKVKNWSSGSARDFYRKDSFQKAKCLYPSNEVLLDFKQLVEPIFNTMSMNLKANENLTQIRDTLLPKLMSGEIRVPFEEV